MYLELGKRMVSFNLVNRIIMSWLVNWFPFPYPFPYYLKG